jgi:hypothetical protein
VDAEALFSSWSLQPSWLRMLFCLPCSLLLLLLLLLRWRLAVAVLLLLFLARGASACA